MEENEELKRKLEYLRARKRDFDEGGYEYFKRLNTAPEQSLNDTMMSFKSRMDDLERLKKRDLDLQTEINETWSWFSDSKSSRSYKTTITDVDIENLRNELSESSITLEKKRREYWKRLTAIEQEIQEIGSVFKGGKDEDKKFWVKVR